MRKFLALFLCAVLALAVFTGCETAGTPAANENNDTEATAPDTTVDNDTNDEDTGGAASTPSATTYSLPTTGIGTQISTDVTAKGDYTIACIVKNSTNPYMVSQLQGVKKAGEDMGVETILMSPATQDSVEEQVQIIEDMIQRGVDAIIIHCVDSNGIMPGIRKANEAGIPVVTIGTPAAEDTFLRTGVNYEETGYEVAKYICEKLGGEGTMIVLEGPPGAQNAQERLEGIQRAVAEYDGVEIVASQTANFQRTEGMSVTENLLQRYSDVDAIIGCNDESALGAVQALKAAGKTDVLVGGFDGSVDASSAVRDGDLLVSYNTDPYGSGYLAAVYLVQNLDDGLNPPSVFTPFPSASDDPLITPDNIDNYIANIAWWQVDED